MPEIRSGGQPVTQITVIDSEPGRQDEALALIDCALHACIESAGMSDPPVVPEEGPADAEPEDAMESEEPAGEVIVEEDVMEETIVVSPTVSEDAPSEPHMGEPPSPSQPQPVVPEEESAGDAMDALRLVMQLPPQGAAWRR